MYFDKNDISLQISRELVLGHARALSIHISDATYKFKQWEEEQDKFHSEKTAEWFIQTTSHFPVFSACMATPVLADALWGQGTATEVANMLSLRFWDIRSLLSAHGVQSPLDPIDAFFGLYGLYQKNPEMGDEINEILGDPFFTQTGYVNFKMSIYPKDDLFIFLVSTRNGTLILQEWESDVNWIRILDTGKEIEDFKKEYLYNPRRSKPGLRFVG